MTWQQLTHAGLSSYLAGNYLQAQRILTEAHEVAKEFGCKDERYVLSLLNLALVLSAQNQLDQAEELYLRALAMNEDVSHGKRVALVKGLNSLGLHYKKIGNYPLAESIFQTAIKSSDGLVLDSYPLGAVGLNNLASLYFAQAKSASPLKEKQTKEAMIDKARECLERSLATTKEIFEDDHPNSAKVIDNLAVVYAEQGEYKAALELHEKGMHMHQAMHGLLNPASAKYLTNLAQTHRKMGNLEKAIELLKRAEVILSRIFGERSLEFAEILFVQASVIAETGELIRAAHLQRRGLDIIEICLGYWHPSTILQREKLNHISEDMQSSPTFCS